MLAAGVAAAILGASLGGCSTSYKLGGLFGSDNGDEKGASTTATAAVPASGRRDGADADLVFAKAAAVELLARGAKDVSQPWE
ncbi:MAG TPA: hypothetical protein VHG27_09190, partial [Xanthobacteraceae bacterium]|nr:hypothetical protein [Xanthobacteraceae bacterium]